MERPQVMAPEKTAAPRGRVRFPRKCELFGGVWMTPTTYEEATEALLGAAEARRPATADFGAVHVLAMAAQDPEFCKTVNAMDLVGPDGQPVRWAMNFFHKVGLKDRVYGPEMMRRLCVAAAERGVSIYLYGSTDGVLHKLSENLEKMAPGLCIAGMESPPFRPLTQEEDAAVVKRINDSGAGLVFIGLGAPKQEAFAVEHRRLIKGVQVCVGAAFDFHAGVKETAPPWMQKHGLEWLYRLFKEPKRLWKRYLVTNSVYLGLFAKHAFLSLIGEGAPTYEAHSLTPSARPATGYLFSEQSE